MTPLQLDALLKAYDHLDYGTKLHLGYALRHRSVVAAKVLVDNHGTQPEFLTFLDAARDAGLESLLKT